MVTDMHSLERAARLSMGDFEATPTSTEPARQPFHRLKLAASLAAVAVLTVAAILLV